MSGNDEKNSDDLVTRRMSSGSTAADDEASLGDAGSGTDAGVDDQDTQVFEAFPADSADMADSDIPAGFSAEEWALINDPNPVTDEAADTDDKPTQVIKAASPAGTQVGTPPAPVVASDTDPEPVPAVAKAPKQTSDTAAKTGGRYGFFDVIATLWTVVATPIVLMALAVRAIASGTFLRFEYFYRPGFPTDQYGFSSDDRLHYASYAVDYLSNVDGSRYLGDIVLANGMRAFNDQELAHMADVKALISLLFFLGVVGLIGIVISGVYLSRKKGPGLRMGYRIGSIVTLVLFVLLAVIAATGFDRFFTAFHGVFFSAGTWQFYKNDTLIRLFPETFWVDGGAMGAAIIIIIAIVLLWMSFIGRKKRKAAKRATKETAAPDA